MKVTPRSAVEILLEKALNAREAAQAVGFTQAACNVMHVFRTLADIERTNPPPQEE